MLRVALPPTKRIVAIPRVKAASLRATWHGGRIILSRPFTYLKKPENSSKPSIHDSAPIVLPSSQSSTAGIAASRPSGAVPPISPGISSPTTPTSNAIIPPGRVPLTPPPPAVVKVQIAPPTTIPPPTGSSVSSAGPSPPPQPKKKPRRFLRFLLTLLFLSGFSYVGGVWYSLRSDNFHDFFTEYIPFGEDAVLYFEEREFRRRFPNATKPTSRPSLPRDTGHKVTIPSKSGLSWKIAEEDNGGSDLGTKGRHLSALDENRPKSQTEGVSKPLSVATSPEKTKTAEIGKKEEPFSNKGVQPEPSLPNVVVAKAQPELVKKEAPPIIDQAKQPSADSEPSQPSSKAHLDPAKKLPEVNEPSVFLPITRIDPLSIKNANEPVVQDLVKIFNDIITVVNADNSSGKFTSTINKAKSELANVAKKIIELKRAEQATAEQKIKSTQAEFDMAAKELVRRLEDEMRDQEARWKDDFESEREKISQTYTERLEAELERSRKISEQRVQNQLLEQAVALKKQFLADIQNRVENERDGRLSKLSELSRSIIELEKLTSEWKLVIDTNLKTQHLQVAIEAVRSSLEHADRPRPFTTELAALKEIAADDPVVNSAIASINPTAYQFGVPTSAQLIDRFRIVAGEVRKAALLPDDAGVASHAASLLLSKLLFRKHGRAIGDDVESVLTRTETLLEEGNLDDAAREMNALTGWAKTLSKDWLGEVRRVLEVHQALDVISTEVRLQSLKA